MRSKNHYHLISWSILVLSFLLIACGLGTHRIPRWGIGGLYLEGKDQFWRGKGGDMDKAIAALESVVREDPMYKDSLTLVARAYYRKARYEDARQILQRALAVNKEDEIAWLVLGMAQLRLGENESGLKTVQGGLTLLSKAMADSKGYRGYEFWDKAGKVGGRGS